MRANPLVTVLMPAYNAEDYLKDAIDSILNQTYNELEFLIINDGSVDKTEEIILSYKDPRIRYIKNEVNLRLIDSLNKGISLAKGKYIARMDADDISNPDRIEKQVRFMEENPEVGLLGSYITEFDNDGNEQKVKFETSHEAIKFRLFFDTHFPHPAAMLRKSVLEQHNILFDKAYLHAEDFHLWNVMVDYCKIAIMPEFLVRKRFHIHQISTVHRAFQLKMVTAIRKEILKKLDIECAGQKEKGYLLFDNFLNGIYPDDINGMNDLLSFLETLYASNKYKGYYEDKLFSSFCIEAFWQVLANNTHFGISLYKKYSSHQMISIMGLNWQLKAKWMLKALFRVKSKAVPKIYVHQ